MNFKVGDRVAVYDIGRMTGYIKNIGYSDNIVLVKTDDDQGVFCAEFHVKQCRKLVKIKHVREINTDKEWQLSLS